MSSKIEVHEELLYTTIGDVLFDFHGTLLKLLKNKFKEDNPLKQYIDNRKGKPTEKELLHKLGSVELTDEYKIFETETEYSKIKIYGMGYETYTLFFIEFDDSESKVLRFNSVSHYNLIVATDVNYQRKCKESISNGNFILCEMLELAAEIDSSERK